METSSDPPTLTPPVLKSEDKLWIVLSHLSVLFGAGILLPLVVYLIKKDESPLIAHHAREALNFHLTVILAALGCFPLVLVLIGVPLLFLLGLGTVVFSIIAAVRGADGQEYRYPLAIRLVS